MELLLLVPFFTNLVMSAIKWTFDKGLRSVALNDWKLRVVLVILSFIGVVSAAALNGTPVEPNQVTDLVSTLVLTLVTAVASHFSYKVIKLA